MSFTIGSAFLDTNVLVYLFDSGTPRKQEGSRRLLETLGTAGKAVISTQVLQEFFVSVTRKLAPPLPVDQAEQAVRDLMALPVVQVDPLMVLDAIGRSRRDALSFWDALIVQAALAGGCQRLLSEDFAGGRRFETVTVENPFAS
jgi:predicted nucleic acid-binding protein